MHIAFWLMLGNFSKIDKAESKESGFIHFKSNFGNTSFIYLFM